MNIEVNFYGIILSKYDLEERLINFSELIIELTNNIIN